jgi:hypothetical protein
MIRDNNGRVVTRNFLLNYSSDLHRIDQTELVNNNQDIIYPCHIQGLEDVRLIDSEIPEFICTCLEINSKSIPQICYCQYDKSTGEVTKIIPLIVGELKCEKNWLPFTKDGNLYFIYTISPLRIYKFNRNTNELEFINEYFLDGDLSLDDFRGSGGLIPYKSGYLGTIHQVYFDSPRKYFHRFIWFDQDSTSIKYSKLFYFESPNIEYTLSLCHSPHGLLIPYSIMDNCSRIGIFSYENLDRYLDREVNIKLSPISTDR